MKKLLRVGALIVLANLVLAPSASAANRTPWKTVFDSQYVSVVNLVGNFCKYDVPEIATLTPAQKRYYCQKYPALKAIYDRCPYGKGTIRYSRLTQGPLKFFYTCSNIRKPVELIYPEQLRKEFEKDPNW